MTANILFGFLSIIYLLNVTPGITAQCPASESSEDLAILLPHASDCSKFYYCEHGEKSERDCPEGLHFNAALKVCDWPESASCLLSPSSSTASTSTRPPSTSRPTRPPSTSRPTRPPHTSRPPRPSPTTTPSSTPSGGVATGPSGLCPYPDPAFAVHLPHPDPTKFYHCSNGVAYVKDCPSPLRFNPALEVCDW